MYLHCESEKDREIIRLIFEGNGFSTTFYNEDGIDISKRNDLPYRFPYLITDFSQKKISIYVPQQSLELEEVERFKGEIDQISEILEEIAVRVGTHYIAGDN